MTRLNHQHSYTSTMSAILATLLEPFKFTYALIESLGDASWHYTIAVAGNCQDPISARSEARYKDVAFDGALA